MGYTKHLHAFFWEITRHFHDAFLVRVRHGRFIEGGSPLVYKSLGKSPCLFGFLGSFFFLLFLHHRFEFFQLFLFARFISRLLFQFLLLLNNHLHHFFTGHFLGFFFWGFYWSSWSFLYLLGLFDWSFGCHFIRSLLKYFIGDFFCFIVIQFTIYKRNPTIVTSRIYT